MSKSKKNKTEDEQFWSKNNGESIKFRKRKLEEQEALKQREDAIKEMQREYKKLYYEDC